MSRCPNVQLLHLGPLGDPLGTDAQAELADLALQYPGRMHCPREGHYVGGARLNLNLICMFEDSPEVFCCCLYGIHRASAVAPLAVCSATVGGTPGLPRLRPPFPASTNPTPARARPGP